MAVFGIGKKKEENKKSAPKQKEVSVVEKQPTEKTSAVTGDIRDVLIRPRITEKATILTSDNVYTFEIMPDANKVQVAEAVKRIYNVTPVKVRIAKQPSRKVFSRTTGTRGVKPGVKKALVTLKDGDTIQFI